MDRILAVLCFVVGVAIVLVDIPMGNVALLVTAGSSAFGIWLIKYLAHKDAGLLTRIFVGGLLVRLVFGLLVHSFDLRDFFGGDSAIYDGYGYLLMESWFDPKAYSLQLSLLEYRTQGVGWGMLYLVGGIYTVTGRNVLAAQSLCAVVGAGIAPLVYVCSIKIFKNARAASVGAFAVAFFPAFIIWTGQLLKDGLIIFLLVLAMVMVLRLRERINLVDVVILVLALFGIVSLRFYIFYMIALAVVGSFVLSRNNSPTVLARNLMILMFIGIALAYVGVVRYAADEFDRFGSLERVQNSRDDLANSADSGFGKDLDVSTVEGAITVVPIGLTYLFLAPFPWQITNFRQAITLPDMIIWWTTIPFLLSGLVYSIRNRLRASVGILIFTFMLSLAYAIFQGNVGTAYRQRAQIQVFLFIFAGVGWTLMMEKRENRMAIRKAQQKQFEERLQQQSARTHAEQSTA